MERGRRANKIWARERIRKQEQEIERLLKEREELRRRLAAHKRLDHEQQDVQHFQALLQQRDKLNEELEKEKQLQKEYSEQLSSSELKLTELRNMARTCESKSVKTQQAVHTWKDKMHRATIRLNELLNKNCHLRDELNTLKIDRAHFHQLHNKLNKKLQEVNKKTEETSNLCHTAYKEKMEMKSMMTKMREQEEKEFAQDYTIIKELERRKEHQFNLKKFMRIKCRTRSRQDNQLTHRQLSEMREQKKVNSGEESEDALKEMFEKIQTVTGEENLDLLETWLIQAEDRNSSLFRFVNEQNNEILALKTDISQVQEKMEQLGVKDLQLEQDLRDVHQQIKEREDFENQVHIKSKILDECETEVKSLLSTLKCDLTVVDDKLGSSGGIKDNIIMLLGVVEQEINELLTIQAFLKSKDLKKDYNPTDLPKVLLGQNSKQIQQSLQQSVKSAVNSMEFDANESSVTDEEEWPLSQEELRRRIMKGCNNSQDLQK